MKNSITFLFILFSTFVCAQTPSIPEKTNKYINDYANVIPDEKESELALICKQAEAKSSAQIVVVTTNAVPKDYPIETYSIDLARNWGIGQKGVNNGLLILICPENHKSRIEVGYGLEGILTDVQTSRMQSKYFKPNFRQGDFYTGIQQCLTAIASTIDPEAIAQKKLYEEQQKKASEEAFSSFLNILMWIFISVVIGLLVFFTIKKSQDKKREQQKLEAERLEKIRAEEWMRKQKAETELKKAKELQNKLQEKYNFLSNLLLVMNDFQNSKEAYDNITKLFKETQLLLEDLRTDFSSYPSVINPVLNNFDSVCKPILENFKIKSEVENFDSEIKKYLGFKPTFIKTLSECEVFIKKYSNSIYEDFMIADASEDFFNKTISEIQSLYENSKEKLSANDFTGSRAALEKAESKFDKIKFKNNELSSQTSKIKNAVDYIEKFDLNLIKAITDIDSIMSNSYVQSLTRNKWNAEKQKIDFVVNKENKNPLEEEKRIRQFIKSLEQYKSPALKNIKDEEDRLEEIREDERKREEEERIRRRKREEEDRRRRNSYDSSSSSWGSSSSSSSSSSYDSGSSSFGGGDFGGGGSSSNW